MHFQVKSSYLHLLNFFEYFLLQQNDLAILELASAVRFTDQVHTLCLSQKEPSISGVDAVVAGWGSAKSHGNRIVHFNQRKFLFNIDKFIPI